MSIGSKGAKTSTDGVLYEGAAACGLAVLEASAGGARVLFKGKAGLGEIERRFDVSGGESPQFDCRGLDWVQFTVEDIEVGEDDPEPEITLTWKDGARGCANYRLGATLAESEIHVVPRGASAIIPASNASILWTDYRIGSPYLTIPVEAGKIYRCLGGLLSITVDPGASLNVTWLLDPL